LVRGGGPPDQRELKGIMPLRGREKKGRKKGPKGGGRTGKLWHQPNSAGKKKTEREGQKV